MSLFLLFHPRSTAAIIHSDLSAEFAFDAWSGRMRDGLGGMAFDEYFGELIDEYETIVGKPFNKD